MALETHSIDILLGGGCPWQNIYPVRVMTIRATHFAFQDWMMVWQAELQPFISMAGKTYFRVPLGIDDIVFPAGGIHMDAARAMANFATLRTGRIIFNIDTRVC